MLYYGTRKPILIVRVNYLVAVHSKLLKLPYAISSERLLNLDSSRDPLHYSWEENHEDLIGLFHIIQPYYFKYASEEFRRLSVKDQKLLVRVYVIASASVLIWFLRGVLGYHYSLFICILDSVVRDHANILVGCMIQSLVKLRKKLSLMRDT